MKNSLLSFLVIVVLLCNQLNGISQKHSLFSDSIICQAKVWSKNEAKEVQYTDWQNYSSHTIQHLIGYQKNKYTVNVNTNFKNNFYHTQKIEGRWFVIDPEGNKMIVTAVNSIKVGNSGLQGNSFSDNNNWISKTIDTLRDLGFNTAGSWSDTSSIIQYNKTADHPFAYTTQLNLLSGYASEAKKKNPERKQHSILSFILDDEFKTYCFDRASKLINGKYDKNLLGHFSDNELPFTNSEMKEIVANKNESDKIYVAFQDWLKQHNVELNSITNEQKQEFIGFIAEKYYKIVSAAIKKFDPNHMYVGSRIHSNAKNNKYLFNAANPYLDIVSINYYGDWMPRADYIQNWTEWTDKPFFITEFYTKADDAGMSNISGAGWIVKNQEARGIHYQNFCLQLLQANNCVGWHWFRYQDNDPNDSKADASNKDSNKGIVSLNYSFYKTLTNQMKELNTQIFQLIQHFEKKH
jgi:hypothetical protein